MPERSLSTRSLLALYAIATLAAWYVGPDGPLYWDSFGYVVQALTGRVGGLLLGRPSFVLVSHGVAVGWRALGGSVWEVEALLRATWMLVSALGAPAMACVGLRAGLSARAAWMAGLLLALAPSVAHTSRAVLTDAPSMAVTLVSIAWALRASERSAWREMLGAGMVLGVAAGLREQAVAHGVTLAAIAWTSPRKRAELVMAAGVGCVLTLGAPVVWVASTQPAYAETVRAWFRAMEHERAEHAYGLRDFGMFWVWLLATGPVTVGLAASGLRGLWAERALRAVVLPSAVMLLALAGYQDIAYSPRYLLAALPCALVLPAARALDARREGARRALVGLAVLTALAAGVVTRRVQRPLREGLRTLPARLAGVPDDAAVVTGHLCPAVVYLREVARAEGASTAWVQVCPGWRWPARLSERLDALRAEGRVVVIDLREDSWVNERQRRCRDEARRYATEHAGQRGLTVWP